MASEIRDVAAEVAARLSRRGVSLLGNETAEELADILAAVERFESAVEARGGDLFVDDLKSSEPDDVHFVLPQRSAGEPARAYIARIETATELVRQHPDISA